MVNINQSIWNVLVMVTLTEYSSIECFWSWLHWQGIPVLNVLVMVTRYSWNTAKAGDKHQSINMECFGHGYIDRVFQYWMFMVMVTLTGYSSVECFWSWLHWQGIPVLNVFGPGYIDRIFQYWMFWSWLHWQDIQVLHVMVTWQDIQVLHVMVTWQDISVLNVFVVVTLTGYSSIECFCHGYIDRVFQY